MATTTITGESALLKAIPATASATPCTAVAHRAPDTAITLMFKQREAILNDAASYVYGGPSNEVDDVLDELFYRRSDAIGERIMMLPCVGLADFAAKMIVVTDHGEYMPLYDKADIWAEARALIGGAS